MLLSLFHHNILTRCQKGLFPVFKLDPRVFLVRRKPRLENIQFLLIGKRRGGQFGGLSTTKKITLQRRFFSHIDLVFYEFFVNSEMNESKWSH